MSLRHDLLIAVAPVIVSELGQLVRHALTERVEERRRSRERWERLLDEARAEREAPPRGGP